MPKSVKLLVGAIDTIALTTMNLMVWILLIKMIKVLGAVYSTLNISLTIMCSCFSMISSLKLYEEFRDINKEEM